MPSLPRGNKSAQHGVSLIESLVAIVVMSLGILGILGVQMRTLSDTQTGVRRAQAIRLIEDLSERMKVNPNALGNINSYKSAFGATPTGGDCKTSACDNSQLAVYDITQWKQLVKTNLPGADAEIFVVADETDGSRRQLGVMVSWRENERSTDTSATGYKTPLVATTIGGSGITCPANSSCHLQYIPLNTRCAAYTLDSTPRFYCPTSKT
nr:type IV pilus modification protein PilV [Acidovorax sp. CF316]